MLVIGGNGSNSHRCWLGSEEYLAGKSSSLLVVRDAQTALLLGEADLFQGVGGHGGDDRGLSAVAVLIGDKVDLDDGAVIKREPEHAPHVALTIKPGGSHHVLVDAVLAFVLIVEVAVAAVSTGVSQHLDDWPDRLESYTFWDCNRLGSGSGKT